MRLFNLLQCLCSYIVLVLWDYRLYVVLQQRVPLMNAPIDDVASFMSIDAQLQYNRNCYFPQTSYASLESSLFLRF